MGVSDEAKNVIPLKFLRKIKKIFFPLVNSIPGQLYIKHFKTNIFRYHLFSSTPRLGYSKTKRLLFHY
jgi:hypothetical protein